MAQFKTRHYVVEAIRYADRKIVGDWLKKLDPLGINFFWDTKDDKIIDLYVKPHHSNADDTDFILVPFGCYIIKESGGYKGFYPCAPDIFTAKYESYNTPEDVDDDIRI